MLTNPKIEYLIIELQLKNNHLHSKVDFFFLNEIIFKLVEDIIQT
jgi:hypothetical protein